MGCIDEDFFELRDIGKEGLRSVDGDDFIIAILSLHEEVKAKLQESSYKYKKKEYLKRKEAKFEEGDLVLAHIWKERFPRGECNKIKLKKIGPCKILRKLSDNAYEIELTTSTGISPIFNVANMYHYAEDEAT